MNRSVQAPQKPAKAGDLAKELSLSVSTISRALRDDPSVRDTTRRRVAAAAARVGYVPNPTARTLRTGRSRCVGLIVPSLKDLSFVQKVADAHTALWAADYDLAFACSEWDPRHEAKICRQFLSRKVDGVMLVTLVDINNHTHLAAFHEQNIPVLMASAAVEPPYPWIHTTRVDARATARLPLEHLLQLGHRDIALLGLQDRTSANVVHRAKLDAIDAAIADAGEDDAAVRILDCGETSGDGYHATRRLIESGERVPTAIQAVNDYVAVGAAGALCEAGYQVPRDVSVVGSGNSEFGRYFNPPLTTVSEYEGNLGVRAAERMLELIDHPGTPPTPRYEESRLILRKSTCPPRT